MFWKLQSGVKRNSVVYNVQFVQSYCFPKQQGREEHTVMCSLWSFCLTWKWRQAIVELSRFTNQGQIWPSLCQCGGRGNGVKTVSTEPQPFAQFWAQSENWKQNASGMLATGHAGSSLGGWFCGVLCSRWERRKSRIISFSPLGYGQKQ